MGIFPQLVFMSRVMQEVERPLLKTTLKAVMGNQKKAARNSWNKP